MTIAAIAPGGCTPAVLVEAPRIYLDLDGVMADFDRSFRDPEEIRRDLLPPRGHLPHGRR